MNVRILDAHQDFFMGKTIKVVIQFTIVSVKVYIKLSLKQKLICVDII
jgi:hypothetical protein